MTGNARFVGAGLFSLDGQKATAGHDQGDDRQTTEDATQDERPLAPAALRLFFFLGVTSSSALGFLPFDLPFFAAGAACP